MLSKRDEEILKAVHFYRYMTAEDVARLLFSIGSLTYVRSVLSLLAGGQDRAGNQYLYRFRLPAASSGNKERIFTLGSKGRDFLQNGLGIPVTWYYRPTKMEGLHFYSYLVHSLLLTKFLVAAHVWSRAQDEFKLVDVRTGYELTGEVIPDAWLLFERKDGSRGSLLVEIDRGTEYQIRLKQHFASRLEFIRSGEYLKTFNEKSVRIAYITTGETPHYGQTRRARMCQYAREVLREQKREKWAGVFRFGDVSLESVYTAGLFDGAVWSSLTDGKPAFLLSG